VLNLDSNALIDRRDMKVPFNQSYWVIPAKLLAGCYPGSEDRQQARRQLKGLLDHGIRHVINLMRSDERNWFGHAFVPYEKIMQSIADSKGLSIFKKEHANA